jgi:hypothetical protein
VRACVVLSTSSGSIVALASGPVVSLAMNFSSSNCALRRKPMSTPCGQNQRSSKAWTDACRILVTQSTVAEASRTAHNCPCGLQPGAQAAQYDSRHFRKFSGFDFLGGEIIKAQVEVNGVRFAKGCQRRDRVCIRAKPYFHLARLRAPPRQRPAYVNPAVVFLACWTQSHKRARRWRSFR